MKQEERTVLPGEAEKENREMPGDSQWHDAPYGPPFQSFPESMYPQLYQIPWSYFPGFPYRPEKYFGEEPTDMEENREVTGYPAAYPYQHPYHPYHYPHYHHYPHHYYPYYHHHHYPYYGHPYGPMPYGTYPQRFDQPSEASQSEEFETSPDYQDDARQFFPFFGFPPFGFGFGFGFPFFRPFFPWWI
jgi:hypothetical protein